MIPFCLHSFHGIPSSFHHLLDETGGIRASGHQNKGSNGRRQWEFAIGCANLKRQLGVSERANPVVV